MHSTDVKKQFKVYISSDLLKDFRQLVARKHGAAMRGLISYEVETALKQYMASYKINQKAHTHTAAQNETQREIQMVERANPSPKIYELKENIQHYLASSDFYNGRVPQFIPESHLTEAIHTLKGYDKRTLAKWLGFLIRYGCIKKSGAGQYEFV